MTALTRRAFLERAACAGALLSIARPAAAADGWFVSLNGSLTRGVSGADKIRLAAATGYGGVDWDLGPAKTAGRDATRALLAELKIKPTIANLPGARRRSSGRSLHLEHARRPRAREGLRPQRRRHPGRLALASLGQHGGRHPRRGQVAHRPPPRVRREGDAARGRARQPAADARRRDHRSHGLLPRVEEHRLRGRRQSGAPRPRARGDVAGRRRAPGPEDDGRCHEDRWRGASGRGLSGHAAATGHSLSSRCFGKWAPEVYHSYMNGKGKAGPVALLSLLHTAYAAQAEIESKLGGVGLSLAKLFALKAVADAGESLPLGQLAELLSCLKSNVTQLVDRLEADGLVERKPDPPDRGTRPAVLTPAGRKACKEGTRLQQAAERDLLGKLSRDEAQQLGALLRKVGTNPG